MRVTSHLTNGFRVHPNYGNDLRRQYNEVLAQIADSNLLDFMATQITRRAVNINRGPSLAQHVKVANYALS